MHQLSFVDVTVFMRRQSEKREVRIFSTTTQQETIQTWQLIPNSANFEARLTARSGLHTPCAAMTSTVREQKLQFSICKTTRLFAGPSLLSCGLKPSFTKICIRISFCKTSLLKAFVPLTGLICAFRSAAFSGGVYPPSATSRTISFSISNSFWYLGRASASPTVTC